MIDNAPAHSRCEPLVENFEAVSIKRLPPFSQELHVIEFMYSNSKTEMKKNLNIVVLVEDQVQKGEALTSVSHTGVGMDRQNCPK